MSNLSCENYFNLIVGENNEPYTFKITDVFSYTKSDELINKFFKFNFPPEWHIISNNGNIDRTIILEIKNKLIEKNILNCYDIIGWNNYEN